MVQLAYADAEDATRTWARAHTDLIAVVGHRTFFRLPDDYLPSVKGSAISLSLVGGTPDSYTPLDPAEIQFSCWGATKADAAAVRRALIGALNSLARVTVTTTDAGDVTLVGAVVTSSFYRPDLAGDPPFPRYIVTAVVAVLPSS